jgi:glycosyltransferase involved in cell wall biosynthesis
VRILFLNHNRAWQGGFFRAYHWGRYLARVGHAVTVLTISESNRWAFEIEEREGIKLIKTPDLLAGKFRSGWDMWDTLRRVGYVMHERFEIVHSVDSRPVCIFPGLVAKQWKGAKLVIDWGDWWGHGGTARERSTSRMERLLEPIETFFEEGFRCFGDGSVVLTSALERRAVALGVPGDRIVRVPHGADIERVCPLNKAQARVAIGIDSGARVVGYVGSIFPRDADLLARAFGIVQRSEPRTRLLLIGNCNVRVPEPLMNEGAVFRTGPVSYELLQQYIAACDVMLLPLRDSIANRGRWPSKIGDYLAAGRPVIASRVGDVANLIEEGHCGLLSDDTPENFASKVLHLLADRNLLAEMADCARMTAETKLDWNLLAKQLEGFYQRIADSVETQPRPAGALIG